MLSGSGNVATYACEKVIDLGGKCITMSDSSGYITDMVRALPPSPPGRARATPHARTRPSLALAAASVTAVF